MDTRVFMVRPSAKVKTSTNVNQGKKQNVCVAFCLKIKNVAHHDFADLLSHASLLVPVE